MPRAAQIKAPPLTPEQDALFHSCLPACYYYAGKMARPGDDREELVSKAMVALVRAAQLFDPGRGLKFCTYAVRAIQNAVISHYVKLARREGRPVEVSLSAIPPGIIDIHSNYRQDLLGDLVRAEGMEALKAGMRRLRRKHRRAIRMRYLEEKPLHELGAAWGMSKEGARQTVERAVEALRKQMGVQA